MKLKNESLSVSLMISSVWSLRSPKPFRSICCHSFWLVWFCDALHLLWEIREEEMLSRQLAFLPACLYCDVRFQQDFIQFLLSLVLQMSHAAVSGLCRAIKLQCELYSSRQIAICLDPYCGLGFVLWCLCR